MFTRLILPALFTLAACGNVAEGPAGVSSGKAANCSTRAGADLGGPFSLIDHNGRAVTEKDFAERFALVFFGFTYCPDVCPFTLNKLKIALEALPDAYETPNILLVSVDPERDTPEQLKLYLSNDGFPEGAIGLTGPEADIKEASEKFYAFYQRIEDDSSAAGYTMDHSSIIYLMDKDWQLATFFTHEESPDQMANCMADYLPKAG